MNSAKSSVTLTPPLEDRISGGYSKGACLEVVSMANNACEAKSNNVARMPRQGRVDLRQWARGENEKLFYSEKWISDKKSAI